MLSIDRIAEITKLSNNPNAMLDMSKAIDKENLHPIITQIVHMDYLNLPNPRLDLMAHVSIIKKYISTFPISVLSKNKDLVNLVLAALMQISDNLKKLYITRVTPKLISDLFNQLSRIRLDNVKRLTVEGVASSTLPIVFSADQLIRLKKWFNKANVLDKQYVGVPNEFEVILTKLEETKPVDINELRYIAGGYKQLIMAGLDIESDEQFKLELRSYLTKNKEWIHKQLVEEDFDFFSYFCYLKSDWAEDDEDMVDTELTDKLFFEYTLLSAVSNIDIHA